MIQKTCKVFVIALLLINNFSLVRSDNCTYWVKEQLARLSLRQKIGQLMMVSVAAANEDPGIFVDDDKNLLAKELASERLQKLDEFIRDEAVGGVICFKGDPESQARLLSHLQEVSDRYQQLPLLVAQDAEWGLAMRLRHVPSFPKNMTLGAIQDARLLKKFGECVGFMCRAVGVHINFAPVVDCNTNPNNPVIGIRAFHEHAHEVYERAKPVIKGMLRQDIVPVIKHAFGHGDTRKDSHKSLPKVMHTIERLKRIEMQPFKRLVKKFKARIGVMMGHMVMPAVTKKPKTPVSLSRAAVTGVLREKWEFRGLVFTDALNMRAITKYYDKDLAVLKAFVAGNDIILYPEDLRGGIKLIEDLVRQDSTYLDQLNDSVKRILSLKWRIIEQDRVMPFDLAQDDFALNKDILDLKRDLYEAAVTLVRDNNKLLPLSRGSKIGYLKIGGTQESLPVVQAAYPQLVADYVPLNAPDSVIDSKLAVMADCTVVIVALGRVLAGQSPYGNIPSIDQGMQNLLDRILNIPKPVVLSVLTSPYALKFLTHAATCVVAYEDDFDAEIGSLKAIFGDIVPYGNLPITVE